MIKLAPPPTYAPFNIPSVVNNTVIINPIWLKWFIDLSNALQAVGISVGPNLLFTSLPPSIDSLDTEGDTYNYNIVQQTVTPSNTNVTSNFTNFSDNPLEESYSFLTSNQVNVTNVTYSYFNDSADTFDPDAYVGGLPVTQGVTSFGDGSTWSAAGLSDTSTYTTNSLIAPVNFSYNVNYSSTANGQTGFLLTPILTSTGATAGNLNIISLNPSIGNSANDIANARGMILTGSINGSYSGTVSTYNILQITANSFGTKPITNLNRLLLSGSSTNGSGITSGTVTNSLLNIAGDTIAAGVGGTVNNYGGNITLGGGSSAGTTNIGVLITGNGGAASVNYAIKSTSTAPSLLAGPLVSTVPDDTAASTPTIASATTIAPTTPYLFVSGTTTIQTITVPGGTTNGCQITIIPTGLFVTGLTGNIALASTAIVSKALIMTYSASTSKWYPSY